MYVVLDFESAEELEKYLLSELPKRDEKLKMCFGVEAEIDELKVGGELMWIDYQSDNKNIAEISVGEDKWYPEEPNNVYSVDITDEKAIKKVAKQIFADL